MEYVILVVSVGGSARSRIRMIELPEGLKKNNTTVRVTFAAAADGSLNLSAEILDSFGNKIDSGELHVNKESDLL